MPHWNWHEHEGEDIQVRCYANAAKVELILNDESLGTKKMPAKGNLEWQVPFAPGTLCAIGYDKKGKEICRTERKTASAPAKISLDASVIGNVAVISAAIEDKAGTLCPRATNVVEFSVPKGVEILGVSNGNPLSQEPDKDSNQRAAYHGLCQIIVRKRSKSKSVTIKASSFLLKAGNASI